MFIEPDEQVEMMQLEIDALSRAVLHLSSELVKVGMAEHSPDDSEMIELGAWGIGLLTKGLGYKLEEIRNWEQVDEQA